MFFVKFSSRSLLYLYRARLCNTGHARTCNPSLTFGAHVLGSPSVSKHNTFFPEGDVLRVRASLRLHVRAQKSRPLLVHVRATPSVRTYVHKNRSAQIVPRRDARTRNTSPSGKKVSKHNTFGGARTCNRSPKGTGNKSLTFFRTNRRFVRNDLCGTICTQPPSSKTFGFL